MKTLLSVSRAIALALVAAAPAAAATMAVPHRTMPHPIRVTTCNPQRNVSMSAGYSPAYWPGGPYWGWPSAYGYSYYSYPVAGNPSLSIDYSNSTDIVMKDIEFGLMARGQLVAEVRDVGTFSPGAEIKHEFGLNRNVFPLGTSIVECVPLHIVFADGSKWKNPHLPAIKRSIYGHPNY